MNERLITIDLDIRPTTAGTLGNNYLYHTVPVNIVIVAVVCEATANDADLTVDINDDGSGVIAAIACATKATPGTWISTHLGGSETPVAVAADSVLSLDANSAAANTGLNVTIWALVGEAN